MTFEELPLFIAIRKTYGDVENPRSSKYAINEAARLHIYHRIFLNYPDYSRGFPWSPEQVLTMFDRYGKSPCAKGADTKKDELTCDVALTHGRTCFYANRGLGVCDEDVELDRIVPESRGGSYTVENCLIACRTHNNARRDTNIEDYIRTGEALVPRHERVALPLLPENAAQERPQ